LWTPFVDFWNRSMRVAGSSLFAYAVTWPAPGWNITKRMSLSQRMESSIAFLISPIFRLANVD
jgi:hypothetical protein